jgi:soluble lytic murein transglycosylase
MTLHHTSKLQAQQRAGRRRLLWSWGVAGCALILAAGFVGWFWPQEARALVRRAADPLVLARVEAFAPQIRAAAEEFGLDPNFLASMVYAESSGRPEAVSSAQALGLMQLLPDAAGDSARRLGLATPTRQELLEDPRLNLRLGASHLAWTLAQEGADPRRALVAYNAGRTRLRRWIREAGSYEAWYAEQRRAGDSGVLAYADKVLAYAEVFRERGEIATAGAGSP